MFVASATTTNRLYGINALPKTLHASIDVLYNYTKIYPLSQLKNIGIDSKIIK